MQRRTWWAMVMLMGALTGGRAATAATAAGADGGANDLDRWWEIRLSGQPTGFFHESIEAPRGGARRTTQEMLFVVNRLGSKVEVKTKAETVEDAEGIMQSVHSASSSSRKGVILDASRGPGGLTLHSKAGDQSYDRLVPVSEALYGPRGVDRLCREKLAAVGDAVSYAAFAPEFGAVVHYTRTLASLGSFEGRPALAVEEKNDLVPGVAKLWLGRDGALLDSATEMPFGIMEVHPADRAVALRAAAGSELRAESYDRTMARSNVRLPDPRSIEAIKLRLTHKRPDLGWPAFAGPGQRVLERTPTTLVLEVRRPSAAAATIAGAGASAGAPMAVDAAAAPLSVAAATKAGYLTPNAILQSDDPEVVRLARTIGATGGGPAGGAADPHAVVRQLQDWVAANVDLDLGVALAPASEVARDRRGTCIAFAVLLAALERAAGIPSRIAMGLVYYEGIWGGHAWTEVALDGRWVPIDAAAYAPGVADAARIQFGSYTAEDNLAAANGAGLQMYGNVEVAVLEYTAHGHTVRVPEAARSYTLDGDIYGNPWLGVAIRKPPAYRFGALQAVYPDATVVAIEDGVTHLEVVVEGMRIDPPAAVARRLAEITSPDAGSAGASAGAGPQAASLPGSPATEEAPDQAAATLGGHPAWIAAAGGRSRLVARDGNSLWVLTASGPHAAALLAAVASAWTWTPPN